MCGVRPIQCKSAFPGNRLGILPAGFRPSGTAAAQWIDEMSDEIGAYRPACTYPLWSMEK
jgi:hypothetical protein